MENETELSVYLTNLPGDTIPLCGEEPTDWYELRICTVFILIVNYFTCLLNALHLYVLQLRKNVTMSNSCSYTDRRQLYYVFLQLVSCLNMFIAICSLISSNSVVRERMEHSLNLTIIICSTDMTLATFRLCILCLASYERYVAICQTLVYDKSWTLQHSKSLLACIFITIAVTTSFVTFWFSGNLCIDEVSGFMISIQGFGTAALILSLTPLVFITSTSYRVIRSIKCMNQRWPQIPSTSSHIITRIFISTLACWLFHLPLVTTLSLYSWFHFYNQYLLHGTTLMYLMFSGVSAITCGWATRLYCQRKRELLVKGGVEESVYI